MPRPGAPDSQLHLKLPKYVHDRCREEAARRQLPIGITIRLLIEDALDRRAAERPVGGPQEGA